MPEYYEGWVALKGGIRHNSLLSDYLRGITPCLNELAQKFVSYIQQNTLLRVPTEEEPSLNQLSSYNLEFLVHIEGKEPRMVIRHTLNGRPSLLLERPVQL